MIYFRSPGRINLIGEHTDYNGGYVLPAAVNRYTYVGIEDAKHFEVYSQHFKEKIEFTLDEKREKVPWLNYVKGALFFLREHVGSLKPLKLEIGGDLPLGRGLSSSASLMVGIIYAVSRSQGFKLSRREVATMAHAAEKEFVGVECGIMDQYAVALAKKDKLLFLDAASGEFESIDARNFPQITVIDSGVKHDLSTGEYNIRKYECKEAEKFIGMSLRKVTLETLEKLKNNVPLKLYKRALHVVSENKRVTKAVRAIEEEDWQGLGSLLYASHNSLRDLYEVSTPEIDYIVESLRDSHSIYGARMVGGGFGGSVLVLYDGRIEEKLKKLKTSYEKKFQKNMNFLHVKIGAGVRKISKTERVL